MVFSKERKKVLNLSLTQTIVLSHFLCNNLLYVVKESPFTKKEKVSKYIFYASRQIGALTRSGTNLKCCRNPPWCPETCSHFVPANSLNSLRHAYVLEIRARSPRGVGILLYKLLRIYKETLKEWEKELKKWCINSTLPVQQKSSPGRGMLPNFSASSGSSRTASASWTGGVWVFGEGGGMQEGFVRECTFFPVTQRIQNSLQS